VVTVVELTTLILVAGVPPNVIPVAPVNPIPVNVTDAPPISGPEEGLTVFITTLASI